MLLMLAAASVIVLSALCGLKLDLSVRPFLECTCMRFCDKKHLQIIYGALCGRTQRAAELAQLKGQEGIGAVSLDVANGCAVLTAGLHTIAGFRSPAPPQAGSMSLPMHTMHRVY